MTDSKKIAFKWTDDNAERISDFHHLIWCYAEPALREYQSCNAFVEFHRGEGFKVEEGIAGMPTAYLATWGEGKPVIATFTEYDAVPGMSQEAVTYRSTPTPYAPGHTDTHSALGVGALVGATAAKAAMEALGLKGTIKVFGTPAEKIHVGKPYQAARGYYDGLDAAVIWHPKDTTTVQYEVQTQCQSNVAFIFECFEPEKWVDYGAGRCPGALDAICLMYTTSKYTKEAMAPSWSNWRTNEAVLVAGQCTSDNLSPKIGIITYTFRSSSLKQQKHIYKVLQNNAEAAAKATGCTVTTRWVSRTRMGLPNLALSDLAYENLELIGAPKWTDEEKEKAREIARNLGHEPPAEPYDESLTPPQEYDRIMSVNLPPSQRYAGGDDCAEFSWHCPTVRILVARPTLKVPDVNVPLWTKVALRGMKGVADRTIYTAGKAIAGTMLDLVTDPARLEECQKEFSDRTRDHKLGPLLPSDLEPPIDLPWPEYISTVRGREWRVPPLRKA